MGLNFFLSITGFAPKTVLIFRGLTLLNTQRLFGAVFPFPFLVPILYTVIGSSDSLCNVYTLHIYIRSQRRTNIIYDAFSGTFVSATSAVSIYVDCRRDDESRVHIVVCICITYSVREYFRNLNYIRKSPKTITYYMVYIRIRPSNNIITCVTVCRSRLPFYPGSWKLYRCPHITIYLCPRRYLPITLHTDCSPTDVGGVSIDPLDGLYNMI